MPTWNAPREAVDLGSHTLQGRIRPQPMNMLSFHVGPKDTMEHAVAIYPGVATKYPYWRLDDNRYTAAAAPQCTTERCVKYCY